MARREDCIEYLQALVREVRAEKRLSQEVLRRDGLSLLADACGSIVLHSNYDRIREALEATIVLVRDIGPKELPDTQEGD